MAGIKELLPSRAAGTDRRRIRHLAEARAHVGREAIAAALAGYHGSDGEHAVYRGRCADHRLTTSILTRPSWLDLRLPLGADRERLRFTGQPERPVRVDQLGAHAAIDRIAAGLQADLRMVNAAIYDLTDVVVSAEGIGGAVALAGFFDYALTLDLLEPELADTLAAGLPAKPAQLPPPGPLPARPRRRPRRR